MSGRTEAALPLMDVPWSNRNTIDSLSIEESETPMLQKKLIGMLITENGGFEIQLDKVLSSESDAVPNVPDLKKDDIVASLQQKLQDQSQQIEALQNQVQDLQKERESIAEENRRLKEDQKNDIQSQLSEALQENRKLRKELSSKQTEVKNHQMMFCGLAKEKAIMTKELTLKASLIADLEEHVNDLKVQNETLAHKLEAYAKDCKAKLRNNQGALASLQIRNKELTEQLLKSSEGCRLLKRKYKEFSEQNKLLRKEIHSLKGSMKKQDGLESQKKKEILKLRSESKVNEEERYQLP